MKAAKLQAEYAPAATGQHRPQSPQLANTFCAPNSLEGWFVGLKGWVLFILEPQDLLGATTL
jgi:hypothetical protein